MQKVWIAMTVCFTISSISDLSADIQVIHIIIQEWGYG